MTMAAVLFRWCKVLIFFLFLFLVEGRKHHLKLINDKRRHFSVSTFGFLKGGRLEVQVNELSFTPSSPEAKVGFSLTRTVSDSVTPYLENHEKKCIIMDTSYKENKIDLISFVLDFKNKILRVNCSQMFSALRIGTNPKWNPTDLISSRRRRRIGELTSDSYLLISRRRRSIKSYSDDERNQASDEEKRLEDDNDKKEDKNSQNTTKNKVSDTENTGEVAGNGDNEETVNTKKSTVNQEKAVKDSTGQKQPSGGKYFTETDVMGKNIQSNECSAAVLIPVNKTGNVYSFQFFVLIGEDIDKGLYSLYFHNCANYETQDQPTVVNLTMVITEENRGIYLSAGEIPLPQLYFGLSLIFFSLGCFWIYVIRKKKEEAFKIHYLMGLLVFLKSFSLLFHGINYYFIAREGFHIETWAVLFYITHLLKGALLFVTLVLIGTGWTFIKHIFADKEKKIFAIIVPLQVLANVAEIIMEESEEGEVQHSVWREVFILVDLLCCGAILFPIVWSIRHLREASQTDGKAAVNLQKLKLFRHFYVMIICYIYFTRIIVYLLKITLPFQYEWLDEFFKEGATLSFFVLTGYNFRPTLRNPYFRLSQDDPDLEMEEVVTKTGLTEGISKNVESRNHGGNSRVSQREINHEDD